MAKRKKPAKRVAGPYLATAVFCESIIEDSRGIVSAVGITDGCQLVISPQAPADFPSSSNPLQMSQNILIIFRTGEAPGPHELSLVLRAPDGKRGDLVTKTVELSQPSHGGITVKSNTTIAVHTEGVYWVDVLLDGKRYTRMPFNVAIQRAVQPSPPKDKKGSG
jgi:hypothetical protein